jgi:hypothetical protein
VALWEKQIINGDVEADASGVGWGLQGALHGRERRWTTTASPEVKDGAMRG